MGIPIETRSPPDNAETLLTVVDDRTRYINVCVRVEDHGWSVELPLSTKPTVLYDPTKVEWPYPQAISLIDMRRALQEQNPGIDVVTCVCPTMLAFIYTLGEFGLEDIVPKKMDVSDIRQDLVINNLRV